MHRQKRGWTDGWMGEGWSDRDTLKKETEENLTGGILPEGEELQQSHDEAGGVDEKSRNRRQERERSGKASNIRLQ